MANAIEITAENCTSEFAIGILSCTLSCTQRYLSHRNSIFNPIQFRLKGVVRLIRAKKSIFSIIFFKDTINIYLFV